MKIQYVDTSTHEIHLDSDLDWEEVEVVDDRDELRLWSRTVPLQ